MNNNTTISIPKLTGRDTWSTWSFAVKAYLQHEDLYNCISSEPNPDDPKSVKDDVKAKSKLILLVDPILYVHIQQAETAKQVWDNLTQAFEDSGLTRKVGLLKDLINTTLETSESVEAYVNKIMTSAHKLRNINFNVDDEWLGTLMLAGLPESYKPMIMGIESSGVKISSDLIKTKLLQEVKSVDSNTTVLYTKHNNSKQLQNTPKKGPRCFVCNKYGHISKNCKSKKAKQDKNKDSGYVAVFAATTTKFDDGFYIDSGASMHLTMRQDWLYDEVPPPIKSIKIANNKMLPVKSCGKIDLNIVGTNGEKQTIQITNVLYVPELTTNLLSVSEIIKNGCSVQFTKQGCKIFNKMNTEVVSAKLINNMYRLNTDTITAYSCSMNETDFLLWHKRMAHLNFNDLNKLSNCTNGVKLVENKNKMVCEMCQKGKQSRLPFPAEGSRAQRPLELIHSDVCGPLEVKSLGGARYFLTFIDDYTRKVYVYFLHNKSDAFSKFKEYKALVENQLDFKIKCLRTDNGREYLSNDFSDYLKKSGIIHQTSNSYTPQQNGLAERMNRTLMERARCMLINSDLQKCYWAEAVSTAAYITNRCPTRALSYATPEEKWSGNKPDVSYLKIFGCEAMVKIPKEKLQKLDPKASKMIFIGYSETTKGYKLLDPKTNKVVISRDVVFMESSSAQNHIVVPLTTDGNEVNKNELIMLSPELKENSPDSSESNISVSSSNDDSFHSNDDSLYVPETEIDLTHDDYVTTRSKARKHDNNTYLCQGGIPDTDVPQTYKEALSSVDGEKWKQSIIEELKAHEKNETWTLVKKEPAMKTIGCRWVFRIKNDPSGVIYKSRLCAKGCSQHYQIDYTETFSPTVRYDSVRILLSEACQHDLNIMQFDVKTAFLYGDIKENIYMTPPEGIECQPNLVCKLNRSLYGLKQAPRCWNNKFKSVLSKFGFVNSHSDQCVFTGHINEIKIYLLLYVDDGLIISKDNEAINKVINDLKQYFEIKTMEPKNFVGLQIERSNGKIFIHQKLYIEKLLLKFNMSNANGNSIPIDPHTKLEKKNIVSEEKIPYREAVGSLMHLAIVSRPDIMYGVSLVSRYLDSYDDTHWAVVKKILKYLKETKEIGILYSKMENNFVEGYSDSDYAADSDTRRSTTGYVFIKNGAAITWATQRQQSIALSTTEAEFMAACSATKEAIWIKRLLLDISEFNQDSINLNVDNQSAISLIKNVDFHKRCKHIDVKYKFIQEKFQEKEINVKYLCTTEQCADMFTKALACVRFQYLRAKIGVTLNE